MPPPLCFETICLRAGRLLNLPYHQDRLHRTRAALWGRSDPWSLADLLPVPAGLGEGTFKCRLTYGRQVEQLDWEPYTPRPIRSLRLVHDDTLDYTYKYQDRHRLQVLLEQRGTCDDVLIVRRGLLTDTSYCNLALFDGQQWLTPAAPLLEGTQRAALLDQGLIREATIRAGDLGRYSKIKLFNAMLPWEEAPALATEQVVW
jgi:4-amino-4-deoxychorismate lyase